MKSRISLAACSLLAPLLLSGCSAALSASGSDSRRGFEVWIADQSDTRPGFGGQLLVYEGSDLMEKDPTRAQPTARIDLAAATERHRTLRGAVDNGWLPESCVLEALLAFKRAAHGTRSSESSPERASSVRISVLW